MRFGWAALAVFALTAGHVANARQDRCSDFTGQTVKPETFAQVVAAIGNVAPKDEYETTAQYRARIAAASPGAQRIISKEVEDRKYFEYDADTGMLRIRSYAIQNKEMNYWSAFYSAHPDGLKASTLSNIAVVVSSSDSAAGNYEAENSYGAKVTVQRLNRTTDAIFEREAKNFDEKLFALTIGGPVASYIGQIKMTPAEAQAIKPQLRVALVVAPRAPFMVLGRHQPGETTRQYPFEINETFQIMIADIHCGLLMDGANRVIGAYATN